MLHIINQFPIDSTALNRTRCGDTILFADNAVLAIKKNNHGQNPIQKALTHLNSCVCKKDLINKGVSLNEILSMVCVIDDHDLQAIAEDSTAFRSCN